MAIGSAKYHSRELELEIILPPGVVARPSRITVIPVRSHMTEDFNFLPDNLPEPINDGAARHLVGHPIPDHSLPATDGTSVNLARLKRRVVVFCYPMMGNPGRPMPEGWDDIPGARGCTPQACSFRDRFAEFAKFNVLIYGLSTQIAAEQQEASKRLQLPYPLLYDGGAEFTQLLRLPNFSIAGQLLVKRLTVIASAGVIEAVHYPVFPSNSDPGWVVEQLATVAQQ